MIRTTAARTAVGVRLVLVGVALVLSMGSVTDDGEDYWAAETSLLDGPPFDILPSETRMFRITLTTTGASSHRAELLMGLSFFPTNTEGPVLIELDFDAEPGERGWSVPSFRDVFVEGVTETPTLNPVATGRECLGQACTDSFVLSVTRAEKPSLGTVRVEWDVRARLQGEEGDPEPADVANELVIDEL